MTTETNRQFLLAKRPVGAATRDTFTYQQVPVGQPKEGQILVKNQYLSLDPAMREKKLAVGLGGHRRLSALKTKPVDRPS